MMCFGIPKWSQEQAFLVAQACARAGEQAHTPARVGWACISGRRLHLLRPSDGKQGAVGRKPLTMGAICQSKPELCLDGPDDCVPTLKDVDELIAIALLTPGSADQPAKGST